MKSKLHPSLSRLFGRKTPDVPVETVVERPKFTMPPAVQEVLRARYADADVILEYGSGGSTVVASEMPGKQVYSVESDQNWIEKMHRWFENNPPVDSTSIEIVWADIGPTKAWGSPANPALWRRFADYPLGIWGRDNLRHPDLVLVDGRFRMGCALATAFSVSRPVTLLFDDYLDRPRMHAVESVLGKPTKTVGRMGIFDVKPTDVPVDRLRFVVRAMTSP